MVLTMDGESSVAAQVAAQSADEEAAARASAKSPQEALKHDLYYEEPISQLQIDAAEKAGAHPWLLKRARRAMAKQQEGDGEAKKTSDAAPAPPNPLDLTSELADSGGGDVSTTTPAPKKKVKVNPVLAQLRAPTATQSIVRADQRNKALFCMCVCSVPVGSKFEVSWPSWLVVWWWWYRGIRGIQPPERNLRESAGGIQENPV